MTRKNLTRARWHYYRQFTLTESIELFRDRHGEAATDELLEWFECMAQARSLDRGGDRAWWLAMAAHHRRMIMSDKNARVQLLQNWADAYGRF